jgi:hypothetical protein
VHRHQGVGELGQHGHRDSTAAEVGTGPALGGHRAGDHQHVVVEHGPGLARALRHR